jgi:hypothetical protein
MLYLAIRNFILIFKAQVDIQHTILGINYFGFIECIVAYVSQVGK